jgi:hypothetical protein
MARRVGGVIFLKVGSTLYDAKGSFTYNLGKYKREAVLGQSKTLGYKEIPQIAFIEGSITDSEDLDLKQLVETKDLTITLELANGKTVSLRDAWFAADGNVTTEEGEIEVRFEGIDAEEV